MLKALLAVFSILPVVFACEGWEGGGGVRHLRPPLLPAHGSLCLGPAPDWEDSDLSYWVPGQVLSVPREIVPENPFACRCYVKDFCRNRRGGLYAAGRL